MQGSFTGLFPHDPCIFYVLYKTCLHASMQHVKFAVVSELTIALEVLKDRRKTSE